MGALVRAGQKGCVAGQKGRVDRRPGPLYVRRRSAGICSGADAAQRADPAERPIGQPVDHGVDRLEHQPEQRDGVGEVGPQGPPKISIEVLPPIDLREELGGAGGDPDKGYELVTGRMQDALRALDEARAPPLIG